MKKVLCIIFSLILIFLLCGCDNQDTESKVFSQEVTIVKMPSPPKCKTTDDISVVEEVIAVLGQIEKAPTPNQEINGGWSTMIILNIDGQEFVYTVGGAIFKDSDGKQYNATNGDEIEEKITEIYSKINAPEVDHPRN